MARLYRLLALCSLPSAISALPSIQPSDTVGQVSFPFTKKLHARTDVLRPRQGFTTSVHNEVLSYYVDVNVGSPAQTLQLLLDTGSSDIFVFSTSCSDCSSEYFDTSRSTSFKQLTDLGNFGISYSDGSSVGGYYASDQVGVGSGAVTQTIGIATTSQGSGFDNGIFGIGLDQAGSAPGASSNSYSGYISSLKSQGLIGSRTYSVYLDSKTAGDTATGLIIFGGTDTTKYTGNLVAFPMVEKAPDGQYRLDVSEPIITYDLGSGVQQVAGESTSYTVLLDTGTPLCYLPTAQFEAIGNAVGAQLIDSGPTYSVDCSLSEKSGGISFDFEGPNGAVTISVPWSEMVVPDKSVVLTDTCIFGLAPASNGDVQGVYTLGDTFIRSAYLNFDYDSVTVGIAQADYDH